MILPIYLYGAPVLRKKCVEFSPDYNDLSALIENMWQTMYKAHGVGLAAPQIGAAIRLFLVDTQQLKDEDDELKAFKRIKQVFINPKILKFYGEKVSMSEGCLSIPEVREDVERFECIEIEYYDENFEKHIATFDGFTSRVIQHEYDHIEGVLFTDKIKLLRKQIIKSKLDKISKGKVDADYRIKKAN